MLASWGVHQEEGGRSGRLVIKTISCRALRCEIFRLPPHALWRELRVPSPYEHDAQLSRGFRTHDASQLHRGDERHGCDVQTPSCDAQRLFLT